MTKHEPFWVIWFLSLTGKMTLPNTMDLFHVLSCGCMSVHKARVHTKHVARSLFFTHLPRVFQSLTCMRIEVDLPLSLLFIGFPWSSRRKGWNRRKGRKGDRSVINCCLVPWPSQLCCLYSINHPIKPDLCFPCVPKGSSQIHTKQNPVLERSWKFMHRTSATNECQSTACS